MTVTRRVVCLFLRVANFITSLCSIIYLVVRIGLYIKGIVVVRVFVDVIIVDTIVVLVDVIIVVIVCSYTIEFSIIAIYI